LAQLCATLTVLAYKSWLADLKLHEEKPMNDSTASVKVGQRSATSPSEPAPEVSRPAELSAEPRQSLRGRLVGSLPAALVVLALVGLAYWGRSNDWTLRKFSALIGSEATTTQDWCPAHSVPESICVECNESLLPRIPSTWCRVHGVHNCPFERPEVAQLDAPRPITQADLERAQRALALKERAGNNSQCKLHQRRIQLASLEVMEKMGLEAYESAREAPIVETIAASGEIFFAQPRVAPIFTPVAGRISRVTDQGLIGARVKKGDVLALVDSPEVGKAKAEFLQAYAQFELRHTTLENLKPLVAKQLVSDAKLLETQSALQEAQIRLVSAQQSLINLGLPIRVEDLKKLSIEELGKRLQFLGVPAHLAQQLDPQTTTANLIPLVASQDGVVTASEVVPREMVDAAKTLFVVTDTSRMWLVLNVRFEDVKYLQPRDGMPAVRKVRFRPDGSDYNVEGELAWISQAVDERTRTVQVRADLPNADGKLLANTFGMGSIVLREEKSAIVVPNEALHWDKDCHIVFVRDKNFMGENAAKVFHVRSVRPGVRNGDYTEIIAGVLPGEVVATKNSAVLRAQLLKNNLGAG
jgi:cobalt-zinc-cadmium efflux system membrane fusion protein